MHGDFIMGCATWRTLPFSCRHALRSNTFWQKAEAQLICLIWSRAQELKSCCSLLVLIPLLSHQSKQNREDCRLPFHKDSSLPSCLHMAYTHGARDFYVLLCLVSFVKKQNRTL